MLVMSGTASIGSSEKFQMPSAAIARTAISTSQRWRIAKDSRPSIIVHRRALGHLGLDDKTVAGGVDVAFEHAKGDLDEIGVAVAELDLAHLEFVAGADEHDRMVFNGLQRRGLDRDRNVLVRQRETAGRKQARPQPL